MRAHSVSNIPGMLGLSWLIAAASLSCTSSGHRSGLALRSVVLYQNGIGYFEHRGTAPGAHIDLSFRRHEIGDVLKTITIVPVGGSAGSASAVAALTTTSAYERASEKRSERTGDDQDGATDAGASEDREDLEDDDRVALRVALTGAANELSIAYAVPTASWKPTYRVVLPERGEGQALVQGWAMINNTSDTDWRAISLTLATGAPLSFAIDLLTLTFVPRPDLTGTLVTPVTTGAISSARMAPGDGDGDGIRDADDLCVAEPEDMDGFEDQDGCPDPDNDADRILDASDSCPGEPENYNGVMDEDGCPDRGRVVVTDTNIEILDKIYFKANIGKIAPESRPIVDAIAATLLGNPDIRKLAVQGHASNEEKDPWGLSSRRASAVVSALRSQGVTTELVPEPYGASQPLRMGKSEDARAVNRRAEFLILERTDDEWSAPSAQPERPAITRSTAKKSVKAQVEARDIAGSVRYRIQAPVTIDRGASALVPIINEEVPGEDIFLFRPEPDAPASERHPWRAARVSNRTPLEFQPGPVAIFARGAFVGEGLIERLHQGETAYIPYALDSSCTVSARQIRDEEPVRIATVERGVIEVENRDVLTTRYTVRTGAKAPARILIQHQRAWGYEGVDLPPRTRDDGDMYMVPLPIQAGRKSVFDVVEKKPTRRTIYIHDARAGEVLVYLQGDDLPAPVKQALERVMALKKELDGREEATDDLRQELVDVGQRADEIRASLRALSAVKGGGKKTAALRRDLLDGLSETTKKSEAIARDLAAQSATLAELRVRFSEAMHALSYTRQEEQEKAE